MAASLAAALRLARPANCLIGGLSILIAALITGPVPAAKVLPVALAVLSGMLITAGANAINDWYDIEIDRINRPDRVLPQGHLTPRVALAFAIFSFVCGIFFSIFIHCSAIVIATASIVILIAYSAYLKRTVLWGNATVSLITALAFIYGASAAGPWQDGLIPAVFAFLFHFGREILKDIEDIAGDSAVSAVTLPIKYGTKPALVAMTVIYSVLVVVTFLPYLSGQYGAAYLFTVVIGVDLVLTATLIWLWVKAERANLRRINTLLKADMLVGLFAIYLG